MALITPASGSIHCGRTVASSDSFALCVLRAAVGTWRVSPAGNELDLQPTEERGWLADEPLRHLHVRVLKRNPVLIRDADVAQFQQDGPSRLTCFRDSRQIDADFFWTTSAGAR